VLEHVEGRPFLVLPEVFNPKLFWTSEVFVESLNDELIRPGSDVLDLGTGSGVVAVFAAQWARRVIAVDINPVAVRCARINAVLNQVDCCIDIREGDLFDPVKTESFDVITFNPPFLPGIPTTRIDQAFYSTGMAERFASELTNHLKPNGIALLILSSLGDEEGYLNALQAEGFSFQTTHQKRLFAEKLSIYKISLSQDPD